jgi:hypothetical protein
MIENLRDFPQSPSEPTGILYEIRPKTLPFIFLPIYLLLKRPNTRHYIVRDANRDVPEVVILMSV